MHGLALGCQAESFLSTFVSLLLGHDSVRLNRIGAKPAENPPLYGPRARGERGIGRKTGPLQPVVCRQLGRECPGIKNARASLRREVNPPIQVVDLFPAGTLPARIPVRPDLICLPGRRRHPDPTVSTATPVNKADRWVWRHSEYCRTGR